MSCFSKLCATPQRQAIWNCISPLVLSSFFWWRTVSCFNRMCKIPSFLSLYPAPVDTHITSHSSSWWHPGTLLWSRRQILGWTCPGHQQHWCWCVQFVQWLKHFKLKAPGSSFVFIDIFLVHQSLDTLNFNLSGSICSGQLTYSEPNFYQVDGSGWEEPEESSGPTFCSGWDPG